MAIFNEDGPIELYDAEAERNSAYCDRCGGYHGGRCPPERTSDEAFDEAIEAGRLSAEPGDANYAGTYMFMGTRKGKDLFKHIMTREYLA